MEKSDILLTVLAAADGTPVSPVQLQKSLFLIGKSGIPETRSEYYNFEPYDYGPFDALIYRDAESLGAQGLAVQSSSSKGNWTETRISPEGLARVKEFETSMLSSSSEYIRELVGWVLGQSFAGLVRHIYDQYPEYRENSVFQG